MRTMSDKQVPGGVERWCGCIHSVLGADLSFFCTRDYPLRREYSLTELTRGGSDRVGLAQFRRLFS